ncbi:MAG: SPOR domain-containing protein [Treponema sp.]|jgi:cell division septation protein DedD|nr:SPOR domain-containing protein [Treponema sp.]
MPIRFSALLLIAALSLIGGTVLHAQSGPAAGTPAGTELQNIEKTLTRSGISAAERQDALIRLARLRQLSGDIEGAAKSWLEAAAAEQGENGDNALAAGASCLAAMGEWEKAAAALRPLLASSRRGPAFLEARYIDASLKAWASGDTSSLSALTDDPEYAELRPRIYYTLWKTGAEGWEARLLAEFPRAPESRIAAAESDGASAVTAKPSPLWLLLPGRESFSFSAAPAAASSAAAPAAPSPATASPAPEPAAKALQTGLFSNEANARAQSERLKNAGFSPALARRTVNGSEYWTVTVPAGQNTMKTIQELKNAGFESFPLF